MCPHQRHPTTPYVPPNLRPKPANLPSLHGRLAATMLMHVQPPPSFDAFKPFALSPHGQSTRTYHRLPPWLDRCRLHHNFLSPCTLALIMHHVDRPWLRPNSSDPLASSLHLSFTTAWCIDAKRLACPSSPHGTSHPSWNSPFTAMPSAITSHPTTAHQEPIDTSNPHNIVHHSSSKGEHHWFSYIDTWTEKIEKKVCKRLEGT